MTLSPGQILNNRYRIVKLLGQGGFGAVYRAWDMQMEGACAVKENLETSPAARKQFEREAKLLYKLRHPNLPRVFDHFLVHNQGQYLVMDYIEGEDLGSMILRTGGPLAETQVIDWISQVCDALTYLHAQNPPIIHRDIKPANIRITPEGQAMLVDFGIAKLYDPSTKTTTGARAVTPGYSPPEQFGLGSTDAQSDVYALGATIYHLLTGHAPPAAMDVMAGSSAPPRPVHLVNPAISPQVSLTVENAMKPNRSERLSSAAEFKMALSTSSMVAPMQPAGASLVSPTIQSSPGQAAYVPSGLETATQAASHPKPILDRFSPRILWAIRLVLVGLLLGVLTFVGLNLGRKFIHPESTQAVGQAPRTSSTLEGEVTQVASSYLPSPGVTSPVPVLSGSPAPTLSTSQAPALQGSPLVLPTEKIALENVKRVSQLARWGKGTLEEVAWSPRGDLLAVASSTGAYIYDAESLTEVRQIATGASIRSLAFSPDGQILATGLSFSTVQIWRVTDGSLLYQLENSFFYDGLVFSPDGESLASGSSDSAIRVWRVSDGSLVETLKDEPDTVVSLAFSPDGQILASGHHQGMVQLWQVSEGSLLRKLRGHQFPVYGMTFSPDGAILVSGAGDTTVRLWNVSDGALMKQFGEPSPSSQSLALSSDGKILATGMSDGNVNLLSFPDTTGIRTLSGHSDYVIGVAFSPDGTRLASVSQDHTVRQWRIADGSQLASIEDFTRPIESISVSPDVSLLASTSTDSLVSIWLVADGNLRNLLKGHVQNVHAVAFSPDGNLLATGGDDTTARLWFASDGSLDRILKGVTGITSLAFSPNGNVLATGLWDNRLRLWELSAGSAGEEILYRELQGHTGAVQDVAFSPDGEILASASWDNTVNLWRVSDDSLIHTLKGHSYYVYAVVFSPDGKNLASGSLDCSVKVWNVSDGSLLNSYSTSNMAVNSLAISPDGGILAIGLVTGDIQLIRFDDGNTLHTLNGHTAQVTRLVFSADGLFLASGSRDGTIRIWGVR